MFIVKATDVELLQLAITSSKKTQEEFAKHLDMTRQNLSRIIRSAEKSGGKLSPKFLNQLHRAGVNIYQWQSETNHLKKDSRISDSEIFYETKNISELVQIIKSQQEMLTKQQDTIYYLVTRKKAS